MRRKSNLAPSDSEERGDIRCMALHSNDRAEIAVCLRIQGCVRLYVCVCGSLFACVLFYAVSQRC